MLLGTRVVVLALALACAFSLGACGVSKESESTDLDASWRTSEGGQGERGGQRGCFAPGISARMQEVSEQARWLSYSEGPDRGHAILKHVDRSEDALRHRLEKEPNISASSSFPDLATAEAHVGRVLDENKMPLEAWMQGQGGPSASKWALRARCDGGCGLSIKRGLEPEVQDRLVVVVRKECLDDGAGIYVLTAYPGE